MNLEHLEAKWDHLKGRIKEKWGKLTDDDLAMIQGRTDQLLAKIRERYGYGKEETERQIMAFVKTCKCESEIAPESEFQWSL